LLVIDRFIVRAFGLPGKRELDARQEPNRSV